jgi:hypothetical protein
MRDGRLYVTKNRAYFNVLARFGDRDMMQTVNVDCRPGFVEEEISIPEKELIKMARTIWEIEG